uniref:Uncharacterized protein n=1 Tax=Timema monikensis TaxID=170555 RepID=A0A7R9E321_9NEOP|nr:unnamed protein product [Timema monikensis]
MSQNTQIKLRAKAPESHFRLTQLVDVPTNPPLTPPPEIIGGLRPCARGPLEIAQFSSPYICTLQKSEPTWSLAREGWVQCDWSGIQRGHSTPPHASAHQIITGNVEFIEKRAVWYIRACVFACLHDSVYTWGRSLTQLNKLELTDNRNLSLTSALLRQSPNSLIVLKGTRMTGWDGANMRESSGSCRLMGRNRGQPSLS